MHATPLINNPRRENRLINGKARLVVSNINRYTGMELSIALDPKLTPTSVMMVGA